MAMSDTAREIMWLRGLLSEISLIRVLSPTPFMTTENDERDAAKKHADQHFKPYPTGAALSDTLPTVMLADNQGAIQLANNPVNHERTKHIDIKHHYIREMTDDNNITPVYVNTKLNDADMFTKTTCTTDDFVSCRERVMGNNQTERLRRHADRQQLQHATEKDKIKTAREKKAKVKQANKLRADNKQ